VAERNRIGFVCGLFRVPTDEYLDLARAAEAAGFDALSLSDHVVHVEEIDSRFPYTPEGERPWRATDDYPDVWVATAMMAAATRRLHFLQAITVLPLRDPFTTARALGTLARMSGHRVSLGFGVGWMREEFEILGQPFEGRGARAEEMVELMKKLWSGEVIDHRGVFYRAEGVRMRPAAGGPIPILCSGESEAALRRAARIGDGWIPPISLATPETLAARLETLHAYRTEVGRAQTPFSVYWTPGIPPERDTLSDLARMGVTHLFVTPWAPDEADHLDLPEKRTRLEHFGQETIGSMRA